MRCGGATTMRRGWSSQRKQQAWSESVVLIDAARTPFALSGSELRAFKPHDLAREALRGVLAKTGVAPEHVEAVCLGTVIQEVKTSNVAREAALQAGLPLRVPAHTVTQACISANAAVATLIGAIAAGSMRLGIAGGVESMSDVPIRFSPALRSRMLAARKIKSPMGYLGLLSGLRLSDLAPDAPPIAEFSTGETMGHSADRLAAAFGVSREGRFLVWVFFVCSSLRRLGCVRVALPQLGTRGARSGEVHGYRPGHDDGPRRGLPDDGPGQWRSSVDSRDSRQAEARFCQGTGVVFFDWCLLTLFRALAAPLLPETRRSSPTGHPRRSFAPSRAPRSSVSSPRSVHQVVVWF